LILAAFSLARAKAVATRASRAAVFSWGREGVGGAGERMVKVVRVERGRRWVVWGVVRARREVRGQMVKRVPSRV